MRIHVWSPGFAGFGGGIGAASREIARALAANGHELGLFGKADIKGKLSGAPLSGGGTQPPPLRSVAFASQLLAGAVSQRPERIICLHVNHAPVAALLRRSLGIEYVVIAHGVEITTTLRRSRRRALRAASSVVAVSAWTKERLIDFAGADVDRIAVIPNTFDDGRFSVGPAPEALRARYGLGPTDPIVLILARLSAQDSYKGVDRLIEAWPEVRGVMRNARLLIAGEGDDSGRLRRLAQSLGVQHAVTFCGFVQEAELADHYRLADVFAMPSTGEGFGIVFLEAMGCGTPCLAGNRDGSGDALGEGSLGLLVDPLVRSAIAQGLIRLLQRRAEPMWFDRQALHDAVAARFGREAYRQRFADLLPAR